MKKFSKIDKKLVSDFLLRKREGRNSVFENLLIKDDQRVNENFVHQTEEKSESDLKAVDYEKALSRLLDDVGAINLGTDSITVDLYHLENEYEYYNFSANCNVAEFETIRKSDFEGKVLCNIIGYNEIEINDDGSKSYPPSYTWMYYTVPFSDLSDADKEAIYSHIFKLDLSDPKNLSESFVHQTEEETEDDVKNADEYITYDTKFEFVEVVFKHLYNQFKSQDSSSSVKIKVDFMAALHDFCEASTLEDFELVKAKYTPDFSYGLEVVASFLGYSIVILFTPKSLPDGWCKVFLYEGGGTPKYILWDDGKFHKNKGGEAQPLRCTMKLLKRISSLADLIFKNREITDDDFENFQYMKSLFNGNENFINESFVHQTEEETEYEVKHSFEYSQRVKKLFDKDFDFKHRIDDLIGILYFDIDEIGQHTFDDFGEGYISKEYYPEIFKILGKDLEKAEELDIDFRKPFPIKNKKPITFDPNSGKIYCANDECTDFAIAVSSFYLSDNSKGVPFVSFRVEVRETENDTTHDFTYLNSPSKPFFSLPLEVQRNIIGCCGEDVYNFVFGDNVSESFVHQTIEKSEEDMLNDSCLFKRMVYYRTKDKEEIEDYWDGKVKIEPYNKQKDLGILIFDAPIQRLTSGNFEFLEYLTFVKIPDTVEEISKNAFCDCIDLVSFVMPSNIKKLSDNIFKRCYNLEKIYYKGTEYTTECDLVVALTKNGVDLNGPFLLGTKMHDKNTRVMSFDEFFTNK